MGNACALALLALAAPAARAQDRAICPEVAVRRPKCGLREPTGQPWSAAFVYYSSAAFASLSSQARLFREPPPPGPCERSFSLHGLQDLPPAYFSVEAANSANTWANTPEGEWTAVLNPARPRLQAALDLGQGARCLLESLSLLRPSPEELALRLNFAQCSRESVTRQVLVQVRVEQAGVAGPSKLTPWVAGLAGGAAPASLSLRSELAAASSVPATHRQLTPLRRGCFEAFSWLSLEGIRLRVNSTDWYLLSRRLPVAGAPALEVQSALGVGRACVSLEDGPAPLSPAADAAPVCGHGRGDGGGPSILGLVLAAVCSALLAAGATVVLAGERGREYLRLEEAKKHVEDAGKGLAGLLEKPRQLLDKPRKLLLSGDEEEPSPSRMKAMPMPTSPSTSPTMRTLASYFEQDDGPRESKLDQIRRQLLGAPPTPPSSDSARPIFNSALNFALAPKEPGTSSFR